MSEFPSGPNPESEQPHEGEGVVCPEYPEVYMNGQLDEVVHPIGADLDKPGQTMEQWLEAHYPENWHAESQENPMMIRIKIGNSDTENSPEE